MKYTGTLGSKGRVTIPVEIRQRLGLTTGDRIDFVIEGDRTVIRPCRDNPHPFEKQLGILGPFPDGEEGTKAWIDEMRGSDE
jgi:AbrB family looped-hinge helix DNA binding protein